MWAEVQFAIFTIDPHGICKLNGSEPFQIILEYIGMGSRTIEKAKRYKISLLPNLVQNNRKNGSPKNLFSNMKNPRKVQRI